MRHPNITAGRQGLPPTSDIGWSATNEMKLRTDLALDEVMGVVWIGFMMISVFSFWHSWMGFIFVPVGILGVLWTWRKFYARHRLLSAMLLNRPRDTSRLTEWTEHRWLSIPERFRCKCGCLLDMNQASYFKDTKRYALICDCGRGHFMTLKTVLNSRARYKRVQ